MGRTCTSPVAMSTRLVSPDWVEQQMIDPAGATSAVSAVGEASIGLGACVEEIVRVEDMTVSARQSIGRIR